jgi:hypothetical protein
LFHDTATVQSVAPPAEADSLAAALSLGAAELGADVAAPPPLEHAARARTPLNESASIRRLDMRCLLLCR